MGRNGMINPCDENRQFSLNMAEISVFDQDVYNLINDLTLLIDMAKVCMYVCVYVCVCACVHFYDHHSFSMTLHQEKKMLYCPLPQHLPRESPRAHEALYTANQIVNICDPFNKETFPRYNVC